MKFQCEANRQNFISLLHDFVSLHCRGQTIKRGLKFVELWTRSCEARTKICKLVSISVKDGAQRRIVQCKLKKLLLIRSPVSGPSLDLQHFSEQKNSLGQGLSNSKATRTLKLHVIQSPLVFYFLVM